MEPTKTHPLVADLMTPSPNALGPSHHLARAAKEMEKGRIRHLPIVDRAGQVVGVLSLRDVLAAPDKLDRPISDVMRSDVKTIQLDAPAHEAAYLILRHAIGCVPVVDDSGKLAGIITDTDFVRAAYTLLGGAVPVDELEAEEREAENV